jgi:hexosaminidase
MFKRILKISGIVLVILLAAAVFIYFKYLKPKPLPISAEDRAAITLMPLPASLKLTGEQFILTPDFGAAVQGPEDEIVSKAVNRFLERTAKQSGLTFKREGKGLAVYYITATTPVQPVETDESYKLVIDEDEITIEAATGYGALRALESLSQLLKEENGKFVWPSLKIDDNPRYQWRGLMIDVARHWIPKEVILRNLEAMAAVKLNVFHWHLSDYQGFRLESKVFPKLHELGSEGNYYTQEEVKEIVEFARQRGIRVVPEFDMPGHASGFLIGYPELASAPGPYQLAKVYGLLAPVMDPTREEVYTFIDTFITEMVQLFPDSYFHIGGDEVDVSHWKKNEAIQKFMKEKAIDNEHDLHAYFIQRIEKILVRHNKKMIGWDEILNPTLSNNIVVQSWRTHKSLFEALQKGSKAILSSGYYLDYKLPAAKHYSVDPEVLPGAVTIKPDTVNWQQYELALYVSESPLQSSVVLYGEPQSLRGLFYAMENASAFESAVRNGDDLNFSFISDFGKINIEFTFFGDSIKGKMSVGLISFPIKGKKIGGNDWAGTTPPKVEQMSPLTPEQEANILGGEAAMWTEVVSSQNIDSRIWPRTAAIAEKWWTPKELTKDADDMYRRLEVISHYLEKLGMRHIKGQDEMITDLAAGKDEKAIRTLIDVLEEGKYTSRLALSLSALIPMNEVVDAAQPESMLAFRFTKMVNEFIADPEHKLHAEEIKNLLISWRNNHAEFEKIAIGNARLEKVLLTSQELSMMSNFALQAVDSLTGKTKLNGADKQAMLKAISGVEESRAGTILAVSPSLRKLIESI